MQGKKTSIDGYHHTHTCGMVHTDVFPSAETMMMMHAEIYEEYILLLMHITVPYIKIHT